MRDIESFIGLGWPIRMGLSERDALTLLFVHHPGQSSRAFSGIA